MSIKSILVFMGFIGFSPFSKIKASYFDYMRETYKKISFMKGGKKMILLDIVYVNGDEERIAYRDEKKAMKAFHAIKRFLMIKKATLIYPDGNKKYFKNWILRK